MSKPATSKPASQLQAEMYAEIAKIDKKYLKLIAPHEKEIAKLQKEQAREKTKIENKYIKMIEEINEIDIPFSYRQD